MDAITHKLVPLQQVPQMSQEEKVFLIEKWGIGRGYYDSIRDEFVIERSVGTYTYYFRGQGSNGTNWKRVWPKT